MIRGVGLDTVSLARIERAMARPGFLARILTPEERAEPNPPRTVAGRWAAKEATAKALGTHLRWHDVRVRHEPNGRPVLTLREGAVDGSPHLHLSITHDAGLAIAVVVAEDPG